ncbi:MAG: hypothetical protein J7L96_09190 [Bacteroidales bacterium]|nr:hypothetical protein [Bacteroidales bacterium]
MIHITSWLRKYKILIAGIIAFHSGFQLNAQTEPQSVIKFFQSLYRYQFHLAESQLETIRKDYPASDYVSLSEANFYWWQLVSTESNARVEKKLEQSLTSIIYRYAEIAPDSLTANELFAVVHAYAYQARLAIHHKKRFKALSIMRKIHPYMKIILEQPEINDKIRLLAGLYHYIAAVAYEEYPFSRPFLRLVPKSNKELGYHLLKQASRSEHPLIQTEAIYFLMKINLEMAENFKTAGYWSARLVNKYPDNLIYLFYQLQVYIKSGDYSNAQKNLDLIRFKSANLNGLSSDQRQFIIEESLRYLKKNKKK